MEAFAHLSHDKVILSILFLQIVFFHIEFEGVRVVERFNLRFN
jgi:hypothetical protein